MEFSLSRSLENDTEISFDSFPRFISDPAFDRVNPGVGQIVNLFETVVPMKGRSQYAVEKKMENAHNDDSIVENVVLMTTQTGSGESQIDPEILTSFQHPIVTDSIIFPKPSNLGQIQNRKMPNPAKDLVKPSKIRKLEHKFHVV